MRMKELSELTGIPDRTIRYYISDGIFVPEKYTENYQGRRNYIFTENDVIALKQITTLRKYEFSMKDIKSILSGNTDFNKLLNLHMNHMKQKVDTDLDLVNSLKKALLQNPLNADSLCELLNTPSVSQAPIPVIDNRAPYQILYKKANKHTRIEAVLLVLFIIAFIILNLPSVNIDNKCVINNDYSSLIYEGKTYNALDYKDFDALHSITLSKKVKVKNESIIGHIVSDESLEVMDDVPVSEMVYLQTDYDYSFPDGNPDMLYVEQSVYKHYEDILNDYKPERFFLYKDKYDKESYFELDSELYNELVSSEKNNSIIVTDYFVRGQTGGSYFVCEYQKPFYYDVGEIRFINGKCYYLPYSKTTISKFSDGKSSQAFYSIDSKYVDTFNSIFKNENEE